MYDPKSLKAEEFICHEEIEDTLKYADENKDNMPLIREILDKARLCKGLSHHVHPVPGDLPHGTLRRAASHGPEA